MSFRKPRSRSRKNSTNIMVDSEKWRTYGNRASRRDSDVVEEDSDDDEPNGKEIKDWVEEFFGRRSTCTDAADQDVEVQLSSKQTLILSTLVPDEILLSERFDAAEPKRIVGVLLMADVSGYTALSERYNNMGKGGTYRLTVTLNTYLGALIELIYGHGGDILKFAGDAFLALWKTDKRNFLYHTIHTVIACALLIQHSYAKYETDVKVNLRVKLAISAGNLMFAPIGTGIDMNYVIFGLPVIEAKLAESVCSSGDVKLAPSAWGHCYSRNYDHIVHDDGHVTIKSILYDPHERDITKPFNGFGAMIRQMKRTYCAIENLPDFLWDIPNNVGVADALRKTEGLTLRQAILVAEERNIGSEIRKFMIRPILTQIDAHQPLEYLTEMRQVSILFITLKPIQCPPLQLITIVNNSYQITCEIVYKSMGCVNKIILFDKDVMILVVFGLRGFKHESEAQAALKCGFGIRKSVSALDGVLEVSIGVTTGQVYCGVVGHPLRREFTVIGAIVNKAARLMCCFRNKITCDEVTFVKSKMSSNGFTLQPETELKGIGNPGKIYEYTEEIRVKEIHHIPMIPPLLDRTDDMEYFENWLDNSHLSYRDFDALLLIGESRIGKSRLLEWMARYARNKSFHVCYINLTSIHSSNSYLALSQIFNQMLNLKEPVTGFIKEEKILEVLKVYDEDLCYLNNIIQVRFAYHDGLYSQDEQKRNEKAKGIFTKLIMSISETYVILLDDLQNLDASSWEFISIFFSVPNFFTVLSVTRGKFSSVHKWLYSVFINNSIRKIVLGPLTSTWIPPLACQILDVDAVPNDLCNALRIKCKGMPGLVESFIVHLFSTGAIELKKIHDVELDSWKEEDLQFPDPAQLRPQALNAEDQNTLERLIENDATGEIAICTVTQKHELNTNINVQNIDALIMVQIDSLTPYQQLLLKIASVIGNVVSRDLLENIMYENNPLTTAKAVKRLFAMRILTCANSKSTWYRKMSSAVRLSTSNSIAGLKSLTCDCSFEYELNEDLPKYSYCKVMKFRNKNSRKTCYELLPMNQKKEFHSRIVNNLENSKQKCSECGGTIMVVQSIINGQPDKQSCVESIDLGKNKKNKNLAEVDDEGELENFNTAQNVSRNDNDIRRANSESLNNPEYSDLLRTSSDLLTNGAHTLSENSDKVQYNPILKRSTDDDPSIRRRSTKRVTMTSLLFRDVNSNNESDTIFGMLRAVTEANNIGEWHTLGVKDSLDNIDEENEDKNKKSFPVKIVKGISQINFTKCTCAELNIQIYEQLINHAKQAEMKIKHIEFLIQLSYLNLLANHIEPAFEHLEEAEECCLDKQALDSSTSVVPLSAFEKRRLSGKIYSLKCAAYLISGKLLVAKLEMERAARIYNLNLHKVSQLLRIKGLLNILKNQRKQYRMNESVLRTDSVFCLNVATLLYSTLGDDKLSRASALRALQLVQLVDCNVVDICDAFSNAIHIEIYRGTPDATVEIERIAKRVFKNLVEPIQADELYALGKLSMETFRARIARADLPAAVRSGIRAVVISTFLHAENVSFDIIPDLFYILLCRRRIDEAIDVLQLALRLGQSQESPSCETWYYALCMDMILDAGFELESAQEINRFAEFALHRTKFEGACRRRLVVNLWTYWLRADSERKAKRFESEALSWVTHDDDDGSFTTLMSSLRLAEGMLESLARKMDDLRKVVDLMELRSIADRELGRLEKDCRITRTLYPRWMLLKANSHNLSSRHTAATTLFNQAMEESRRIHNHLEGSLARAALSNSRFWVSNARSGRFMNWRDGAEQTRGSWHQLLYKMTTTRQ